MHLQLFFRQSATGLHIHAGHLHDRGRDFRDDLLGFLQKIENTLELRELPPNRWVKYYESKPGTWHRQGHAGMAFDTRRGSLLIFGSDTHGEDWDNAVHEFQPRLKRWVTHYAAVGPESYRVDADGRPVAGADALLPWAMDTWDGISKQRQAITIVLRRLVRL